MIPIIIVLIATYHYYVRRPKKIFHHKSTQTDVPWVFYTEDILLDDFMELDSDDDIFFMELDKEDKHSDVINQSF